MSPPPHYHGPINSNPGPGDAGIIIYGYDPRLAVGLSGCILFGLFLLAHIWYLARYRHTRIFQALLVVGCAMEVIGYGFRVASHYHPFKIIDFVLQYFMIVCAPIFFSAAIYLALARILRKMPPQPRYSPLSPSALIWTFVVADTLTIITQVAGAALIGVAESAFADGRTSPVTPDQANHILLAGLAVQCASFLVFLVILTFFLIRCTSRPESGVFKPYAVSSDGTTYRPPSVLLFVLTASAFLIFLRTVFRLGETAEGVFGRASSDEDFFVSLEFVPVVVAISLWVAYPLGRKLEATATSGPVV